MARGFSGDPETVWYSGVQGHRRMELTKTFSFTDHVQEWVAQKGRWIDGASIPRSLWTLVGAPYVGRYRRPSIVHDIACADASSISDRRAADRMFYRACRAEGFSRFSAAILYCGVRFGAWTSGGFFVPESDEPRLDDSAARNEQRMFREIAEPVVHGVERLSLVPEEDEALVLERAFDASLARFDERRSLLAPEVRLPRPGTAELVEPAEVEPGHPALPLAGDLEFDKALIDSPCGAEDRVAIDDTSCFPHSAICYLVLDGKARGTGFFISPDTIVTAGHCLHRRWRGTIGWAQVVPGRDGENWPFQSVTATKFHVPAEWARGRNAEFDYGVIKLNDGTLGNSAGHFDIGALPDAELLASELTTAGYPADMELSTRQHVNSGRCDAVFEQRLGYSLDTWKGASGSPVWVERDGRKVVVGIHNYGHCPNYSTRINQRVLDDLRRWIG